MSRENFKAVSTEASSREELFGAVDNISSELAELVSSFSDVEINEIPFEGSWMAAQVTDHVRKSNNGIAQALQMKGRVNERKADERVKELKDVFLDFETKLKSPQFILPGQSGYNKKDLIERLGSAIQNKIMHVSLPIGKGNLLMATDACEEMGFTLSPGNNVYICISPDTKEEADRLYNGLSAGGKISMALQDMFWGAYYGDFTDKFGVRWMVNYTYPKK